MGMVIRLLVVLFVLLLSACEPPPSLPATGRTIRVALGPDPSGLTGWRPEHRVAFLRALAALRATGDTWVESSVGDADVVVEPFDAGARCSHAGEYSPGERRVRIDYACVPGDERLAYALVHELLHYLTWVNARWAGHICVQPGDATDCTALVRGEAVLNPVMPGEFDANGEPLGPPDATLRRADVELLRALGRRP